ncbi:MAG TPA: biopolymer transporter ExbD [Acidiferrobacteraceae bacterium]|nr:biopolymer transporter ExbD [Acidiferrobacteraceae bacterium]
MNFRQAQREEPEINLVPMIDVLLMTLIFLVLTTTFSREGAIKIELPQAQTSAQPTPQAIRIAIGPDGGYAVNQVQLRGRGRAPLEAALRAAAAGQKHPLIVLYADRKAPYNAVIHALDVARHLGLFHLTFATRSAAGGPGTP